MGRLIGLDYGAKRIGVALSDELLFTANAFTVIERKEAGAIREPLKRLGEIVKEYGCAKFVLGHPKNMDGSPGEITQEVERFAQRLQKAHGIPVVLWDERLTSKWAEQALIESGMRREKRKTKIDGVAAALILQNYLDYIAVAEKPL